MKAAPFYIKLPLRFQAQFSASYKPGYISLYTDKVVQSVFKELKPSDKAALASSLNAEKRVLLQIEDYNGSIEERLVLPGTVLAINIFLRTPPPWVLADWIAADPVKMIPELLHFTGIKNSALVPAIVSAIVIGAKGSLNANDPLESIYQAQCLLCALFEQQVLQLPKAARRGLNAEDIWKIAAKSNNQILSHTFQRCHLYKKKGVLNDRQAASAFGSAASLAPGATRILAAHIQLRSEEIRAWIVCGIKLPIQTALRVGLGLVSHGLSEILLETTLSTGTQFFANIIAKRFVPETLPSDFQRDIETYIEEIEERTHAIEISSIDDVMGRLRRDFEEELWRGWKLPEKYDQNIRDADLSQQLARLEAKKPSLSRIGAIITETVKSFINGDSEN